LFFLLFWKSKACFTLCIIKGTLQYGMCDL
jgi:hypothetical protein